MGRVSQGLTLSISGVCSLESGARGVWALQLYYSMHVLENQRLARILRSSLLPINMDMVTAAQGSRMKDEGRSAQKALLYEIMFLIK